MPNQDSLQRFLFEHTPVRGGLIHLDTSWQTVLQRQDYPAPIRELLGQMLAASSLLCASLKFKGTLTLQIQSAGPLALAVAESSHERTFRGIAKWDDEIDLEPIDLLNNAQMMLTLAPEGGRPYQGIIDLRGGNFVRGLEDYMQRSQQVPTRLWLAVSEQSSAGVLLQRMPAKQDDDLDLLEDDWRRLTMLCDTLSSAELLQLPFSEILHRLFYDDTIRAFSSETISFRCSCNRDRVANTLRMLGYDDIHDLLEEREQIEVRCEYCNFLYVFDRIDAEQVFLSTTSEQPLTRH